MDKFSAQKDLLLGLPVLVSVPKVLTLTRASKSGVNRAQTGRKMSPAAHRLDGIKRTRTGSVKKVWLASSPLEALVSNLNRLTEITSDCLQIGGFSERYT